jgi:hypothetical protein
MPTGTYYSEHFYEQASQNAAVLEKNAADFPASSLAAFLLLYHYKKTGHPGFEKLARKTVLYFKNPLWLQFLLEPAGHTENGHKLQRDVFPPDEEKEMPEYTATETFQVLDDQDARGPVQTMADAKPAEIVQMHPPALAANEFTSGANGVETATNPSIPSAAESSPKPEMPDTIPFEPLHTVDYFASQGIKITEEPVSNDKLGQQVKSFTAWLKSMKRLHPSKLGEQDLVTEKLIQTSAEESNVNTEILTEAMAEVLLKQDKKEKAIEMYHKLSLLNPSKNAYFAAKIESIKSS